MQFITPELFWTSGNDDHEDLDCVKNYELQYSTRRNTDEIPEQRQNSAIWQYFPVSSGRPLPLGAMFLTNAPFGESQYKLEDFFGNLLIILTNLNSYQSLNITMISRYTRQP